MGQEIIVRDEYQTINKIITTGCSIARYGDGELKICSGRRNVSQFFDKELAKYLRHVLHADHKNCIIGIPNIYSGIKAKRGTKAFKFWSKYVTQPEATKFLKPGKVYYSSFITRPDNAHHIKCPEYFELCKQMWRGRKVVVVTGKGVPFCKHPNLLENCDIIDTIEGPKQHAWKEYFNIYNQCLSYDYDTLFLLKLGATATVLAYGLSLAGYQALDLGHFGNFYTRLKNESYI